MSQTNNSMIYKICPQSAWEQAQITGNYLGSDDDKRDGFIHFSTAAQLRGTLEKHYAGQRDLLLIGVNSKELGAALKWEPSRGGQLFPHLYADLPVTAAAWARAIALDQDGRHGLPKLDMDCEPVAEDPLSVTPVFAPKSSGQT